MIIIRFAKGLLARQQQQPLATDSSAKSRNANFCLFFASFLLLSRALYLNIRNICACNVFYCTSSHSTNAECTAEQTAFRRISICDFTCLNVTTRRSQLIPNSNTYSFPLQLANAFQILHYPCRWSMFAVVFFWGNWTIRQFHDKRCNRNFEFPKWHMRHDRCIKSSIVNGNSNTDLWKCACRWKNRRQSQCANGINVQSNYQSRQTSYNVFNRIFGAFGELVAIDIDFFLSSFRNTDSRRKAMLRIIIIDANIKPEYNC